MCIIQEYVRPDDEISTTELPAFEYTSVGKKKKKCCGSTNNNQYGAYLRNAFLENLFILVLGNLPAIEVWPNGIFHLFYDTFLEILKQRNISLISRKLHGPLHICKTVKKKSGERAFIRRKE